MKLTFFIIYLSFFILSLGKAEECIYTYLAKPEESKYTKQYSINTDREGHAVRIFSAKYL